MEDRYSLFSPSKVCSSCGVEKASTEFRVRLSHSKLCLDARCRDCRHTKEQVQRDDARLKRQDLSVTGTVTIYGAGEVTRVCKVCGVSKDISKFALRQYISGNKGYMHTCRVCEGIRDGPHDNTEACRQYYEKTKVQFIARVRKWQLSNPEKIKATRHRRRVRLGNSPDNYDPDSIPRMYLWQRGRCACCGLELLGIYNIDHIYPIAKGGTNSICNIQLLCKQCNSIKGAKDPEVFIKHLKTHYQDRYQYYYEEKHGLMVGYYKGDL